MLDMDRETDSFPDSRRNLAEFLRQLRESGHPVTLTINGKAEWVIQDAASHQKLIELAEQAEDREISRKSVIEMKAGLGRPAAEMLADMQRILDEKRGR